MSLGKKDVKKTTSTSKNSYKNSKRTNKHIHHLLKKPGADPIHTISYMNFNYPHTSPLKRAWEEIWSKGKIFI